jgi:hypothetical protein
MKAPKGLPVILLTVALAGCGSDTPTDPSTGSASGNVFQVGTQIGLSGVAVEAGGVSTTTDQSGAYQLQGVATGVHTLKASRPDFEAHEQSIDVQKDQTTDLDIFLTPSAVASSLSGVVREEKSGNPVPDVEVAVAGLHGFTDAEGRYQIPDVPPGSYEITAEKLGYTATSGSVLLSSSVETFDIRILRGTRVEDSQTCPTCDLHLTADKSPYRFFGEHDLNDLTVDPGVTLEFGHDAILIVYGAMTAVGEPGTPIVLKADVEGVQRGYWQGLRVGDGDDSLAYVRIQDAHEGLGEVSASLCESSTLEYMEFVNNTTGIQGDCVEINSSLFLDNLVGVSAKLFQGGHDHGVIAHAHPAIDLRFEHNHTGLRMLYNGPAWVEQSSFLFNTGHGIFFDGGASAMVLHSEFVGNGAAGIAGSPSCVRIFESNFEDHADYAFDVHEDRSDCSEVTYANWKKEGNYIADNSGLSGVDLTLDGSGGQWSLDWDGGPLSIQSASATANDAGADWSGFPQ